MYFTGPSIESRTAGVRIDTGGKLSLVARMLDADAAVDTVYRSDWGRIER